MAISNSSTLVKEDQRNTNTELYVSNKKSYLILKRSMDILLAGIGLIVLSPLFLLLACLIKIEDPNGKVFFKQKRVGIFETNFEMYKFRSMVSNAEELLESLLDRNEAEGALFKMKQDPRITKVGRFIRKTSFEMNYRNYGMC